MRDLVTGVQRYQFSSASDRATCIAYTPAPRPPAAHGFEAEERHLVAGYASGAVRVFHVPSTSTLFKFELHWSPLQQVCTYVPMHLYSSTGPIIRNHNSGPA